MNDCHLICANRLDDGAVVWLDAGHEWVETLQQAGTFDAQALVSATLTAEAAVLANQVVAPTPCEAWLVDGRPEPKSLRERLRARGPSVRSDLGKQAAGTPPSSIARMRPVLPVEAGQAGVYRYDRFEREFLKDRARGAGRGVSLRPLRA
ncbi:DUF2849 domain-containing protein [Pseudomonas putida]|uniref:DUF2849 domain-containing protein n=1 Tax=Pseudomonas putida TaxID=303 RepID=UPI001C40342A|nr:DUF2849 domain-containing protein [Pseudomonas putida]